MRLDFKPLGFFLFTLAALARLLAPVDVPLSPAASLEAAAKATLCIAGSDKQLPHPSNDPSSCRDDCECCFNPAGSAPLALNASLLDAPEFAAQQIRLAAVSKRLAHHLRRCAHAPRAPPIFS